MYLSDCAVGILEGNDVYLYYIVRRVLQFSEKEELGFYIKYNVLGVFLRYFQLVS